MIADRDIFTQLEQLERVTGACDSSSDCQIRIQALKSGSAELQLIRKNSNSAHITIALPSSGAPQYWLYAAPRDAEDWTGQLLTWLEEEVRTGGLTDSRARTIHNGKSYVIVEPYGWRLSDAEEHVRLIHAAGAHGWYGDVSE